MLVHCQGGVSRSASVVAAYLMKSRRWSKEQVGREQHRVGRAVHSSRWQRRVGNAAQCFLTQVLNLLRSLQPAQGDLCAAPCTLACLRLLCTCMHLRILGVCVCVCVHSGVRVCACADGRWCPCM